MSKNPVYHFWQIVSPRLKNYTYNFLVSRNFIKTLWVDYKTSQENIWEENDVC